MLSCNYKDLVVYFQEDYPKMECRIYLETIQGGHPVIIGYDGEHLIYQEVKDEVIMIADIKPLLRIPLFMKDALIAGFINEGKLKNLRTEDENLLKGKLEATEKHLEDMREFSKKLLDNIINK